LPGPTSYALNTLPDVLFASAESKMELPDLEVDTRIHDEHVYQYQATLK
jgi:hypothetical protein